MSSVQGRTCAVCGHVAETTTEHSVHVTLEHPELNRTNRVARAAAGLPSVARRPVSCWRCARDVDASTLTCENCGWVHPGPDAQASVEKTAVVSGLSERQVEKALQVTMDTYDLDHRGRPR